MSRDRKLLIFGAGEYADVANYYFTRDAHRDVVAFVVDDAYVSAAPSSGRPVVAWSEALTRFDPDAHDVFVAIGYSGLNSHRVNKSSQMAQAGYRLASFLHSRAIAWDGFVLRENCFILEHNTLQPFAQVDRDCVLWSGNHVGHHSRIEAGCFITSHVVIAGAVRVGSQSFLGINSSVRDHVSIGKRNVIGAGSLILADTPDEAVFAADATQRSKVPSSRLRRI